MLKQISQYELQSPHEIGLVYAFITSIAVFLQFVVVKFSHNIYEAGQISMIRFFFLQMVNCLGAYQTNVSTYPPKNRFIVYTIRNLSGALCSPILYWTLSRLPLSLCSMFGQVTPLVVPFLDWIIYKAKYTLQEVVLAILAVVGVMMVSSGNTEEDGDYAQGIEKIVLLFLMFFGYSGMYALSSVLMKEFRDLSVFTINSQFCIFGILMGVLLQFKTERPLNPSIYDFFTVGLLLGVVGIVSQYAFTKAYQLAKPGRVTIINSSHVVIAFLIEHFTQNTTPSFIQVLGSIMTIGCVIQSLRLKQNL